MNTRTYSLTIPAPKSRVFAYLADIENLPQWATSFCQQLETIGGQHWVTTPTGKVLCEIRAHAGTGTVDFLAGPSADQMTRFPARVLDLPGGESLYLFTSLQTPDVSDEAFEAQAADVQDEFENILRAVSPVHA